MEIKRKAPFEHAYPLNKAHWTPELVEGYAQGVYATLTTLGVDMGGTKAYDPLVVGHLSGDLYDASSYILFNGPSHIAGTLAYIVEAVHEQAVLLIQAHFTGPAFRMLDADEPLKVGDEVRAGYGWDVIQDVRDIEPFDGLRTIYGAKARRTL